MLKKKLGDYMKNNKKKIIILLTFLIIITMGLTVHAGFNPDTYQPDPLSGGTEFLKTGNTIVGVIQVIGIIVSVGVLIILGIKYMVGSIEEKASYKKSMIPYLIGAVMLFAASAVAQILYDFGMGLANN